MSKTKKARVQAAPAPVVPEVRESVEITTLPNLYPGVRGRAVYVRMLQEALIAKGYRCPVTGEYDEATTRAVQRMQISHKMLPNARVGVGEWRALMT